MLHCILARGQGIALPGSLPFTAASCSVPPKLCRLLSDPCSNSPSPLSYLTHTSCIIPFPPSPRVIVNSAKLIAEKIDRTGFEAGYDWCISCLRDVGCTKLANEVHLAKASKFLSSKEFEAAISVFKVGGASGVAVQQA